MGLDMRWKDLRSQCRDLIYALPNGTEVTINLDPEEFEVIRNERGDAETVNGINFRRRDIAVTTVVRIQPKRVYH